MRGRRNNVSTSENVDFKLYLTGQYAHHSSFFVELDLVCTGIHSFVQHTPKQCFTGFVQSAVDAGRQRDENPISSVVSETMKLLANSSYGYQMMERS